MGKSVYLGGNIGYPLSSLVNKIKSGDILVLEIIADIVFDILLFWEFASEELAQINVKKPKQAKKKKKSREARPFTKKNVKPIVKKRTPNKLFKK